MKERWPIETWVGWVRVVMPSRVAASAPSTTAGKWVVAGLRKVPCAMLAPRVAGRAASVAVTEMPLVSMLGTKGLRYT